MSVISSHSQQARQIRDAFDAVTKLGATIYQDNQAYIEQGTPMPYLLEHDLQKYSKELEGHEETLGKVQKTVPEPSWVTYSASYMITSPSVNLWDSCQELAQRISDVKDYPLAHLNKLWERRKQGQDISPINRLKIQDEHMPLWIREAALKRKQSEELVNSFHEVESEKVSIEPFEQKITELLKLGEEAYKGLPANISPAQSAYQKLKAYQDGEFQKDCAPFLPLFSSEATSGQVDVTAMKKASELKDKLSALITKLEVELTRLRALPAEKVEVEGSIDLEEVLKDLGDLTQQLEETKTEPPREEIKRAPTPPPKEEVSQEPQPESGSWWSWKGVGKALLAVYYIAFPGAKPAHFIKQKAAEKLREKVQEEGAWNTVKAFFSFFAFWK